MLKIDKQKYFQIINAVDLSRLKGKSIFITGGTGFFGLWILNLLSLLNQEGFNIKVTLLSRNPDLFLKNNPEYVNVEWLKWVEGDVVNYQRPEEQFDLFIHGAANTKPEANDRQSAIFNSIVLGTKYVMDHAVSANAQRLLIISSGAVYGEVPGGTDRISEEETTAPVTNKVENAYGEAKRASEMIGYCVSAERKIDVITARCFAFAGKGIGEHLVLNQLIRQAIAEDEIVIKGSGLARRSFLHGRDLAIWLLKLLIDGDSGEIYNVGSDEAYTIIELAEIIRNVISPAKKINVLGHQKLEQRMNYIPSIDKAKGKNLYVWTPLAEAIEESKN